MLMSAVYSDFYSALCFGSNRVGFVRPGEAVRFTSLVFLQEHRYFIRKWLAGFVSSFWPLHVGESIAGFH